MRNLDSTFASDTENHLRPAIPDYKSPRHPHHQCRQNPSCQFSKTRSPKSLLLSRICCSSPSVTVVVFIPFYCLPCRNRLAMFYSMLALSSSEKPSSSLAPSSPCRRSSSSSPPSLGHHRRPLVPTHRPSASPKPQDPNAHHQAVGEDPRCQCTVHLSRCLPHHRPPYWQIQSYSSRRVCSMRCGDAEDACCSSLLSQTHRYCRSSLVSRRP